MPTEAEVVVERMVDALNRRDADAFVDCCHPDVEWEENSAGYPGLRRLYSGRPAVREWFQEASVELWETAQFEIEEIAEGPDGVVLLGGLLTARGRESGVETELRLWQVFWFSDGKVVRRVFFFDRTEALVAAGFSGAR